MTRTTGARTTALGRLGGRRRVVGRAGWALRGAAAGAAASTALNATTYLDMVLRGRGSSSTPEKTVERMAELAHVRVPGDEETRQNRLQGLGPLVGTVAGVGVGVVVGLVRASGVRSGPLAGTALTTLGILVAANGPMTALGVTDPRTWSATDWISDLVPHLVYGAVVDATLAAFETAASDRP